MIEDDEIMRELRQVREGLARRFDYDIGKLFDYIRRQESLRLKKLNRKPPGPKPGKTSGAGTAKPRKRRRAA
jgi:hypothetical protein